MGEQLTEGQLLAGMLVHSADNYADLLARWDAGTIAAFVDKMNATAAELGMTQSHFADPSGISSQSQSTASELLKVANLDMEDPLFASLVRLPSVSLPVAGTIPSYTPLLGVPGVVGVKSGYSSAAGGCDVLAIDRSVGGRPVLVLAAVTGQLGSSVLAQAGMHALALRQRGGSHIHATTVVRRGQVVAVVGQLRATVVAASSASLLSWPSASTQSSCSQAAPCKRARRGRPCRDDRGGLGPQHVRSRSVCRAMCPARPCCSGCSGV